MPWDVKDVDRHFGGLSAKEKRMWCHVANGALEAGDDDGKACHKANGVVKKNRIKESISALLVMKANQMIESAKMQMIASVFEGALDNEPEGILRQSGWKKSGSHGDTVHYSHPEKAGHEIHLSKNGNWRHYDGDSALQSGFTGEKLRKHLSHLQESILSEADESGELKGWMSPNGKAHVFDPHEEHSMNHHPEIEKHIHAHLKKHFGTIHPHETEDRRKFILSGMKEAMGKGYARFGRYHGEHYVHYDKDSPTGRQAAEHALNYMKPGQNSVVSVTKKPWTMKKSNDRFFNSPSAAARHIREGVLSEADPRPRVELDHKGNPVIPTREQYAQYFQDMQTKYIQAALEKAHELWKTAKTEPEKKALDLEIEVGEDALKSKSVSEEEWPVEDDPAYNLKKVYPGHSPKDKVSYQSGGDWKGK